MSEVRACPVCGSGSAPAATKCWVCGADLDGSGPAPVSPLATSPLARSSAASDGHGFQVLGWSAFLLGIAFVTLLVGVELALEWPGLLIPYALIVLVAFVALARTAYVQLRRPAPTAASATAAAGPSPPVGKGQGKDIVNDVALGLTIALAVIAGLMLLFVAAVVIFFLVCLAIVAGVSH